MVAFVVALVLALTVAGLEMTLTGRPPEAATLLYIGLLAALSLSVYVLYEHQRRAPFLAWLDRLGGQTAAGAASDLAPAPRANTREEALVTAAVGNLHRLYLDDLAAHRARAEADALFRRRWAHQMKTPVSVLGLMLDELEQTAAAPGGEAATAFSREAVADLRQEVDRLAHGLELMLTSARLDDFSADFVVHRVDVTGILRRVINEQRSAFIRNEVYPELAAPDSPALVDTDEKWIGFVFGQLIGNAVKYSRGGVEAGGQPGDEGAAPAPAPKRVTVKVQQGPGWCRVSITDQGIGIPPQDLPRVCEPFFTGENGRRYPGATGMGLYLANQVCVRLGHRLEITSEPGRGTTASVAFAIDTALHDAALGQREA